MLKNVHNSLPYIMATRTAGIVRNEEITSLSLYVYTLYNYDIQSVDVYMSLITQHTNRNLLWHRTFVLVWKIVDIRFGSRARPLVSCPSVFFIVALLAQHDRGTFKLFKEFSDTSVLENHLSQLINNVWNSLPPQVVDFHSLRSFKRTITLVDFSSSWNVL